MGKYEIKRIVSILLMMMLVVVQAGDSPSSSLPPYNPIRKIACLGECGVMCSGVYHEISSYANCIVSCGLFCLQVTSKSVYNCAASCAISKSINVNIGIPNFSFISFFIHCYQKILTNYDCINSNVN